MIENIRDYHDSSAATEPKTRTINYNSYITPKVTDNNESLKRMHINYFHRKDNVEFNKYANKVLQETNNKPPLFYFITLNQAFNREGNSIGQDLVNSYQRIKKEAYKNNKVLFYALKSMEYFYGTFGEIQDKEKYENFLDLILSHLADYTHLEETTGINSEEIFRQYINSDNRTAEELVQLYKSSYGSANKLKADKNFDIIWYAMGAKTLKEFKDSKNKNTYKNKEMLKTTKSDYFDDLKEKYSVYEKMIYDRKTSSRDIRVYAFLNSFK